AGRGRQDLRNQRGLEVARELELVAVVDLVDELHRDEEAEEQERDEEIEVSEVETVLRHLSNGALDVLRPELRRRVHGEDGADERRGEQDRASRREPLRQPEEDGVRGAEEAPDPPGGPRRRRESGGQFLPCLRPVDVVEAGEILTTDVAERLPGQA